MAGSTRSSGLSSSGSTRRTSGTGQAARNVPTSSLGGYSPTIVGRYTAMQQQRQQQAPAPAPNNALSNAEIQAELTQRKIMDINASKDARAATTPDNVYGGKPGRNHPGDTRFAKVLAALGIQPDLMSAIHESAQIRQSDNR